MLFFWNGNIFPSSLQFSKLVMKYRAIVSNVLHEQKISRINLSQDFPFQTFFIAVIIVCQEIKDIKRRGSAWFGSRSRTIILWLERKPCCFHCVS